MGRKMIDLTGKNINGVIVSGLVDEVGGAGKHKRWYCICPKCGNTFITSSQHLTDKKKPISMCYSCGVRQYNDLTGKQFGRLKVLSRDYESKNYRIKYKCQCECGSIVSVQENHLTTGKIQSCGCMQSSGEDTIARYLTSHNINYVKQKTFEGCKRKYHLKFDFYLPDINAVIEYQGIQHFEPVKFFGGIEGFKDNIERDSIKKDFCISNNIRYYTIAYNENTEDKLKQILSNEDIVWPHGNMKD